MLSTSTQGVIIYIVGSVLLILILAGFAALIIFKYQQRQNNYYQTIENLKITYQNSLLQSQVEMQEQTFQNISREIHDNIGQKLTLVKLLLNTQNLSTDDKSKTNTNDSVNIITEVINDLRDISRSMSSTLILGNGLIKALEMEIAQLQKLQIYNISFSVTGDTIFLDSDKELIIFRIVQEALNNILKHARATIISINLHYTSLSIMLKISDNGIGFNKYKNEHIGTGLQNMERRTSLLNGFFNVESNRRKGTYIEIEIPYNNK
jgi:two-component system NarL family sensor kinase